MEIHCSRGTYARVIANDIAEGLGTVGHLSELRRLQSGPFVLEEAVDMPGLAQIVAGRDDFQEVFSKTGERVKWLPRESVLQALLSRCREMRDAFPSLAQVQCTDGERRRLLDTGLPPAPPLGSRPGDRYLALAGQEFLAVAESKGRVGQALRVLGGK